MVAAQQKKPCRDQSEIQIAYIKAAAAPPDPELPTSMPMRELRVMVVVARRVEAIMLFRRV